MTSNYKINNGTYSSQNKNEFSNTSINSLGELENKTDILFSSIGPRSIYRDHSSEGIPGGTADFRNSPDYMDLDIMESSHEKYKKAPYILSR